MVIEPVAAVRASDAERIKRIEQATKVTDGAPAFCELDILDDRA
jgi:hypothetical protein